MSKQDELDAIFKRIAAEHGKLTAKQVEFAIREIGRIRGEIADMLADYAGADGTIKRSRLMRLLRELETVEQSLRQYGTGVLHDIIEESADIAIEQVRIAFHRVLSESLNTVSLNQNVIDYVTTRFGDDGLVLSDRIWSTSGVIRDAIATQLRSDIIKGESVGTMVRNVRKVYDNQTWMIKRLVVTESNTAYRTASCMSVERSDVIDWVRIVDNGSRHPRHKEHMCYKLAREDRYGEGRGIFRPTDSEIYSPHVNCSSYIVPVLKSEYL
ncbi:hypothetical protein [Caldifermentibacillus hisashii]|uniref:hypothetical protein n=1 Tax=Caldifermentibacillus hisashii TaxID=996558 RepID=UPI0030EAAA65